VIDVSRLLDRPAANEGWSIQKGSGAIGPHVDGGTEVIGDRVKRPCGSRACLLELCSLRSAIVVAPLLSLACCGKGWGEMEAAAVVVLRVKNQNFGERRRNARRRDRLPSILELV
jgi:hypothetical protein